MPFDGKNFTETKLSNVEILARYIEALPERLFDMQFYAWTNNRPEGVGCIACHARECPDLARRGLVLPSILGAGGWNQVSDPLADFLGVNRQELYMLTAGGADKITTTEAAYRLRALALQAR